MVDSHLNEDTMSDDQQGCVQSTNPEDTAEARQRGWDSEDYEPEEAAPVRRCLTGAEILSADDRGYLSNWVPTPEWSGPGSGVYVLTPSGEDRERYERLTKTRREKRGSKTVPVKEMNFDQLRERLMVDFTCNEDGVVLFPCANKEQRRDTIRALKGKAAAPVGRIGDRVIELMGWTTQDIDDMVGNSETDQS
jgi:hypothetical protein